MLMLMLIWDAELNCRVDSDRRLDQSAVSPFQVRYAGLIDSKQAKRRRVA